MTAALTQKLAVERAELLKAKEAHSAKDRDLKAARKAVRENICFLAGRIHQIDQALAQCAGKKK